MVASGGLSLFKRLGATARPESLESRNANVVYASATVDAVLEALQSLDGAWTGWYGPHECERVAADIRAGR